MPEETVNIHFAKTHLSRLLERVTGGSTVVIANAGHPVARLVPYQDPPRTVRPPGALANRGFAVLDAPALAPGSLPATGTAPSDYEAQADGA